MSVFGELGATLRAMDFVQLLLALVFLTGYSIALGDMFGAAGRRRAAGVAVLAAGGFVAATSPWMHGVLLIVGAVAGIGLFIVAAWAVSAVADIGQRAVVTPRMPAAAPPDATTDVTPQGSHAGIGVQSAPSLARHQARPI